MVTWGFQGQMMEVKVIAELGIYYDSHMNHILMYQKGWYWKCTNNSAYIMKFLVYCNSPVNVNMFLLTHVLYCATVAVHGNHFILCEFPSSDTSLETQCFWTVKPSLSPKNQPRHGPILWNIKFLLQHILLILGHLPIGKLCIKSTKEAYIWFNVRE